jgi:hypothetical protein
MVLLFIRCCIILVPNERRKKWQKNSRKRVSLAWTLLCDLCAELIDFLKEIIFSKEFLDSNRIGSKSFSRKRILPFHYIIFFLMNLIKGSYQDELDYFFKTIRQSQTFLRVVTKSAFCKARKKLKFDAFKELNKSAVNFFEEHFQPKTWHGFTLASVDGSTLVVPKNDAIAEHFGVWNSGSDSPCPMARISQMFDVLNKITLDAIISPKGTGERELCAEHFLNLRPKDLVLLDRGYPAYWLFNLILMLGGNFCARVAVGKWKIIRKFFRSGKSEKIITLKAPPSSIKKCQELGLDIRPLKLRLIRVALESGETEILVTSLIDQEAWPIHLFAELYHCRWPVEEDYKVMKSRIQMENFTGKSVLSVYQDFHARVFSKNLAQMLVSPAQAEVDRHREENQHAYQVNFTQALSKLKDTIVLLFDRSKEVAMLLIGSLFDIFVETVEPIRPNRKYPRPKRVQRKGFYVSYKPIR